MQQQADFGERFRHEARILAGLRHPNIVQVYDYGEHEDHSFIVQQLQSGPTLEQELAALAAQGCLMERSAVVQIMLQLADALDYAHSRGLIHRDLKPSNIIRNERGDVVVTDFGIAKTLTAALTKTQTGFVLGTPAYVSPEQARGSTSLSAASDIYALGVILFELLTGQVPFSDPQPMEVLLGHIQQQPPSPRSLRPTLPPAVEHVVLRALAKDPADRYASAGALARALLAAWPAPPMRSIHSLPTAVNLSPLMAGRASAAAGAVAAPMVYKAPPLAHPPTISANARRTPAASTRRPAWRQHIRAGFALTSLPAMLMIIVALFFVRLPAEKRVDTLPTASVKATEAASALSFTTFSPEPTVTSTAQATFTSTSQPAPTSTLQPTFTSTAQPTFTAMPQPTLAPTLAPTIPAIVPASSPPAPLSPPMLLPPQPTFNPADFW
jgi:serine/threonine-protein kinase